MMDRAKGRLKEAAGSLTGDGSRKREGKAEQQKGRLKEKKGEAREKFGR